MIGKDDREMGSLGQFDVTDIGAKRPTNTRAKSCTRVVAQVAKPLLSIHVISTAKFA